MSQPMITLIAPPKDRQGQLLRLQQASAGRDVQSLPFETSADLQAVLAHAQTLSPILILLSDDTLPTVPMAFDGQLLITTAPEAGHRDIAQNIIDSSASAFLAPEGKVDGIAATLFLFVFLQHLLDEGDVIEDAMTAAHARVDAFTLYLG